LEESEKGGGDVQLLFVWLISISYFGSVPMRTWK